MVIKEGVIVNLDAGRQYGLPTPLIYLLWALIFGLDSKDKLKDKSDRHQLSVLRFNRY